MIYEPFAARVASLRDGWLARRQMKHLNVRRDRPARFELLLTLYDWVERSLETIESVYEGTLLLELTPGRMRRQISSPFLSASKTCIA